jgi:hypothetical protein
MEKIVSKTIERELTETECKELLDHQLDTVTGGSVIDAIADQSFPSFDDGRPPANHAAMAAWNTLLRQYGF